jgi:hypothetical protein
MPDRNPTMFKFQITLDRHNPRLMLECDGDTEGDKFMKKEIKGR